MRMFPIQRSTPIPWELAQRAYDTYADLFGTGQSLECLAERGGFGLQEFACLFAGHYPDSEHRDCVLRADAVGRKLAEQEAELGQLRQWVSDLQDGMYVNCVYCGHRYGPKDQVPVAMAEALKRHVATCDKHPMAGLLTNARALHHALHSLLAERDGLTDAFLRDLLQHTGAAIVAAGGEVPTQA